LVTKKLILGYSWLCKHNLEINWDIWEVKMSCCPSRCTTCLDETRAECKHAKTVAQIIRQLWYGPVPTICAVDTDDQLGEDDDDEFEENLPELLLDDPDDSDDKDKPLEDRDRVFYTQFSPPEDIQATSTVSQQLAKAFTKNSAPGREALPQWVQDFEDVFNWELFDSLPERRTWAHAIKLVPDAKPANCKGLPNLAPRAMRT
jgi:hypothetical protein